VEFAEIDWKDREEIQYDDYLADFTAPFHDLRGIEDDALSPTSYVRSQQLTVELMELGSLGIVYPVFGVKAAPASPVSVPALLQMCARAHLTGLFGRRYGHEWSGRTVQPSEEAVTGPGPMNVVPPHVVESGRLPGLSPVHAHPM